MMNSSQEFQPQTDGRFVPIQTRGSMDFQDNPNARSWNPNTRSTQSLTASASGMLRSKDEVLIQCRDAIASLHADLDKERDTREAAISEKNKLQYDVQDLQSNFEREKSRRQDAETNWKRMKREIAELQCQLDDAESESRTNASQAQASRQMLNEKTTESEDLRDQISRLQLENQDLMGKFDVSLVAQRKIQDELDSMKKLEEKHRDLLRDRDRSSAALIRQIEDHKKHSSNLEKTLKQIQNQLAEQTKMSIDREADLHAEYQLQIDEREKALEEHKKELKSQRFQRKDTAAKLEDTSKEHVHLKQEWSRFKDECASLRTELHLTKDLHTSTNSELDKWRAEAESLKDNQMRLTEEYNTLKSHHAVVSRNHDEAVANLKEIEKKHDLLQHPAQKHDLMHEKYVQSERDLADMRARLMEAEEYKSKFTELDRKHSELSFKHETAMKNYIEKEDVWKKLHDERQLLHDEQMAAHKEKVQEKHSEYMMAKGSATELENRLKKLEEELDTTITRLSKTTDACNTEREEKESMKKQIDTLTDISNTHESLKMTHNTVAQEAMALRNGLEEKQLEIEHLTLELRRTKEKSMLKNTENMNRLRDKYQSRMEHLQKRIAQKEAEELKLRAIIETELTVHRRAGIPDPWDARLEDKFLHNVGDRLEKKILNSISLATPIPDEKRKSRSRARDSTARSDYVRVSGLPYEFQVQSRSD